MPNYNEVMQPGKENYEWLIKWLDDKFQETKPKAEGIQYDINAHYAAGKLAAYAEVMFAIYAKEKEDGAKNA